MTAGNRFTQRANRNVDTEILESIDPVVTRAVTRTVSECAYSKGMSLLSGDSRLAPVNGDTVAELQTLHPPGPRLQKISTYADPFAWAELKVKQVMKALRSFKPLSAPGPSGLRPSHLFHRWLKKRQHARNCGT